jgi:hypothetical protein
VAEVMVTEHDPVVPVVQLEAESDPSVVLSETITLAWLFDV